jgi:hypothetical protein
VSCLLGVTGEQTWAHIEVVVRYIHHSGRLMRERMASLHSTATADKEHNALGTSSGSNYDDARYTNSVGGSIVNRDVQSILSSIEGFTTTQTRT